MAKVLNTYRAYTASNINTRSSATGSHSVVGSTVEFTGINTTTIGGVLGDSTHSLSSLCTSTGINHYSGFGPTVKSFTNGGTLSAVLNLNNPTTDYNMGSFAGYNQDALTPGWSYSGTRTINVASGEQSDIWCDATIGEINYTTDSTADVVFTVWENSNLTGFVGYDRVRLNTLTDWVNLTYTTTVIGGITYDRDWYSALFICDDTTGGFSSGSPKCMVPGTSIIPIHLHVITGGGGIPTAWHNKGYWIISPDTFYVNDYIDPATGIFICSNWNNSEGNIDNLQIRATITGTGVVNGDCMIWTTANDGLYYQNYVIETSFLVGNGSAVDTSDWALNITWGAES
jgi:hypothetical protein